ncbi:MAG TPA: hypothetical protein VL949_03375 [Geobacteraceae bacterium]|nr:hypothetical protein [Geobacteraceae bacterium]
MKRWIVFVTVLVAVMCVAPQLWAKTFYLKDGERIECQRYWEKEGRVYVLINRDTLVDFAPGEVDLEKTAKAAKAPAVKKKAKHKKHVKRHAVPKAAKPAPSAPSAPPAATEKKPAVAPQPPSAAKPAPVVKPIPPRPAAPGAKPAPAAPAKPTSAAMPPGTPTLQKELDAVYGKLYAAMRSGDYREQIKYVTGEQRTAVEQLEKAPAKQKELVKKLMSAMSATYTVTGCSVAPDGKRATLGTVRKVPHESYDNANKKVGKTEYKDTPGVVDFVKVGTEWKVALVKEG